MHKLDHIVFAASSLEEGTSFIENKLQIKLGNIGYHKGMGTHNRVVKISKNVYLEVISIDPNAEIPKSKRWFNLDSLKLQCKLRKLPQVIGYVIENQDIKILKYYNPFFRASRDEYQWQFAMPNTKSDILVEESYKNSIMPSLINWESHKPLDKMQDNHLNLENVQIIFTKKLLRHKDFIRSLGAIEKLKILTINQDDNLSIEDYPKLRVSIKDKIRDIIITL